MFGTISPNAVGLPAWLAFTPILLQALVAAAIAEVGGRALGWLLGRGVRRLPPDAHWTERARRGWPALTGAATWMGLSVALAIAWPMLFLGAGGERTRAIGCALAAFLVASRVRARVRGAVRGEPLPSWHERRASIATTWLVFFPTLPIVLVGLAVAPREAGLGAAAVILLTAVGIWGMTAGVGVRLARAIGLATDPDPRLARVVAETAARVGVTPRSISVVPHATANALAFPPGGHLVFTRRALEILDDAGLAAVCAHELGHLGEPKRLVRLRQSGVLSLSLLVGIPMALSVGILAVVALLAALVVWIRVVRWQARRLEERADRVAHANETAPGVYASALEALYRTNLVPAVASGGRALHPHLYDRLLAAGVTPAYPRPAPPPRWARTFALLGTMAVCTVVILVLGLGLRVLAASEDPRMALVAMAATGIHANDLMRLAQRADVAEDPELALTRWVAAARLAPERGDVAAYAAMRLAQVGRCAEANALVARLPLDDERARARDWVKWCEPGLPAGAD